MTHRHGTGRVRRRLVAPAHAAPVMRRWWIELAGWLLLCLLVVALVLMVLLWVDMALGGLS